MVYWVAPIFAWKLADVFLGSCESIDEEAIFKSLDLNYEKCNKKPLKVD